MFSRTSRILFVVAALALIAFLLIQRRSRDEGDDSSRLANFDMARVDDITLQRADATIRLARQDSLWRMTEPLRDIAERNTVISLLDALEHAEVARNLGAVSDLSQFGLNPPAAHILLRAGADMLLDVSLGKGTVDAAWTYALHDDSKDLLLVPTDVARAASLPVNAYRNQRVLDFQTHDISGYELRTTDDTMMWIRRGQGWCSTTALGDTIAGDSVAVEAVLRRLRGLRVASFEQADTAAVQGIATLTLRGILGEHFAAVRFARRGNQWLAHVDRYQRIVVVADDVSDLVALTQNDLRDRRVLQFSPENAGRITFTYTTVSGELVRAGGDWSFPNPAMGKIDPKSAAEFVRALRALKWDGPATASATNDSKFGVSIVGANGELLDQMDMEARDNGSSWYVRSRSTKGAHAIDRAKLDHLATLFQRVRTP